MKVKTTKCRNKLSVATFSASLTWQYRKRIFGEAVAQYGKAKPLKDPVPRPLLKSMRQSWKQRKERLAQKKKEHDVPAS